MARLTPEERYRTDVEFHALVTMLEAYVHRAQFTPTELREAAVLASIHYEQKRVRPVYLTDPEKRVILEL